MTSFPSKEDIVALQLFREPFCVTIYAPFINPNAATNPNAIQLKNLLREAQTALADAGASQRVIEKTLRQAHELDEKGNEFWPHHRASLVLFLHSKLFQQYYLTDHKTPYLITVGKGFNLAPLQAAMRKNTAYLALVLGHKQVTLYEGNKFHLRPISVPGFPADMKSTLNIDEYPSWRELHNVAPAYMGKGSEGYHSQYNTIEVDKQMLTEFFRTIDRRLHRLLEASQLPLVLAGVKYVTTIYRQVNTYTNIWPRTADGNFSRATADIIRNKVWRVFDSEDTT